MKLAIVFVLAAAVLATATAKRYHYDDPLDPWPAFAKEAKDAAKGNPYAIHTCFLAEYVRLNDPHLGGADLEDMTSSTERMLSSLGDTRFSAALRLERPEIIAAAGYFLEPGVLSAYPATRRLIGAAPKVQWQLNQATGDTDRCPLLKKFTDFEATEKGW